MPRIINDTNGFSMTISATFENIDKVCADLKVFFKKHGIEKDFFDVSLGVREALTNAVRYGCNKDSNQDVKFSVAINGSELIICVSDSGPGFDWRLAEQRCILPSETCGRGMKIFKNYFNSYDFNDIGNKLELRKNIAIGDI